jgi:hypothetical protein
MILGVEAGCHFGDQPGRRPSNTAPLFQSDYRDNCVTADGDHRLGAPASASTRSVTLHLQE